MTACTGTFLASRPTRAFDVLPFVAGSIDEHPADFCYRKRGQVVQRLVGSNRPLFGGRNWWHIFSRNEYSPFASLFDIFCVGAPLWLVFFFFTIWTIGPFCTVFHSEGPPSSYCSCGGPRSHECGGCKGRAVVSRAGKPPHRALRTLATRGALIQRFWGARAQRLGSTRE